mmetsp:Transcript_76384/g.205464  ORF Transcript_76384/g.205464 Transcript_76384/m.205464 type:complete len:568 (+) Transcript_76384:723-2426(+)
MQVLLEGGLGSLESIFPVMVGAPKPPGDPLYPYTGNFFQESSYIQDEITDKVSPTSTNAVLNFECLCREPSSRFPSGGTADGAVALDQVAAYLARHGMPTDAPALTRGVKATAASLMDRQAALLWEQTPEVEGLFDEIEPADELAHRALADPPDPPLNLHQLRALREQMRALVPAIHEVIDRAFANAARRKRESFLASRAVGSRTSSHPSAVSSSFGRDNTESSTTMVVSSAAAAAAADAQLDPAPLGSGSSRDLPVAIIRPPLPQGSSLKLQDYEALHASNLAVVEARRAGPDSVASHAGEGKEGSNVTGGRASRRGSWPLPALANPFKLRRALSAMKPSSDADAQGDKGLGPAILVTMDTARRSQPAQTPNHLPPSPAWPAAPVRSPSPWPSANPDLVAQSPSGLPLAPHDGADLGLGNQGARRPSTSRRSAALPVWDLLRTLPLNFGSPLLPGSEGGGGGAGAGPRRDLPPPAGRRPSDELPGRGLMSVDGALTYSGWPGGQPAREGPESGAARRAPQGTMSRAAAAAAAAAGGVSEELQVEASRPATSAIYASTGWRPHTAMW